MNLCKFKDILGQPGKGIHSFRIFNIAVFDVILVLLFSWILSRFVNFRMIYIAIIVFFVGIIAHRIFCVRTTIDKLLFG